MELDDKLDMLADAARFDVCSTFSQGGRRHTPKHASWAAPEADDRGGRAKPVFRVLMSSACAWNCAYCPLRAANDLPRATLAPEELAASFLPRHAAGAVQGLFVSTAVHGGVNAAVGAMLDGVEHLRAAHQYTGYVHVKLLPGTSAGDVERAARLADRISLNLEAPGPEFLARISPERSWGLDLVERLRWARDWQQAGKVGSGLATQFVVGAGGERDSDLLRAGSWLYSDLGLRRVYFGAFRPLAGTPLEGAERTPQARVQRIQQADWLLRQYGFHQAEMPFDAAGDLPLHLDPKLAWALAHPERFPVELNSAGPELLLRVPGIGPVSVERILRLRRLHQFRDLGHLRALGPQAAKACDFVTLD
ncbi:helix-hairpin-helix domain-containing protein, partial [Oscillochloris sp. ZM17-4]|uniref:helix-hairpin-helix domain-containing protein n=1 Tax=Oscillochloris sp. ZM17-4 TaxID=2866714 RepID=UPI001C730DEC